MPEPANDRNHLEARIGRHHLGITSKDVIPILLLLTAMVCGYIIWRDFQALLQHQALQLDRLQQQLLQVQDQANLQTQDIGRALLMHEYNSEKPAEDRLPLVMNQAWFERLCQPKP